MKPLKLKKIAQWCGGTVSPEYEDITVTGVSTNSREIRPGYLFVPMIGTRVDGHTFIGKAVENGAAAVMTGREPKPGVPSIQVKDTLEAIGKLAAGYRASLPVRVLAVTGSVGKTTTKEMLAGILRRKFRTTWTEGNHNNNLGLPLSILDIQEDTELAVLELGMNHFGEMSYLTAIARPNLAVFTNIGTMHIENLGSREGILKAKMEILEGMGRDGQVVMNGDEPLLWALRDTMVQHHHYFGIENSACEVRASDVETAEGGVRFRVHAFELEPFSVFVPSVGQHTVYNALAAIAAALEAGAGPEEVVEGLAAFENADMRQKIYDQNGFTIIEDCYNAGPESMAAALQVLADHSCQGRRIAVLGDMLELGSVAMAEHYRIGRMCADLKIDMLFAYGANATRMVTGAVTGGMPAKYAMFYDDQDQMIHHLRAHAEPGDVLLFKGSRGMKMERALHFFLQGDPE